MVFSNPGAGVVIADGRCGVRLSRLGDADALGYPTGIEVRAGPFSGGVRDDAVNFWPRFVAGLETLYETLAGEAELTSYDGFRLSMVGDGRGGIAVSVEAFASHAPKIALTFEFAIDQSHLPDLLQAIRREFPPPSKGGFPSPKLAP